MPENQRHWYPIGSWQFRSRLMTESGDVVHRWLKLPLHLRIMTIRKVGP